MRSLAREIVLQTIFSRLFNQNDEGLFDVLSKDLKKEDKEFAAKLYTLIMENEKDFDEKLGELSTNFKAERIHNIDRCAIFIGIAELKYFPETPTAVIIDEAVNLSSKYSTENSADFVNGILAVYAASVRG